MYEPFWMMAEELDFSIGFHEGSTNAMPTVGVDRFEEDRAARHMVSHTMEMMLVALSVIWGGVVDRHPRLRVAFLESGGGWIPPWLHPLDRPFDGQGFNRPSPMTEAIRIAVLNFVHETVTFLPNDTALDDFVHDGSPARGEALLAWEPRSYMGGFVKVAREHAGVELVGIESPLWPRTGTGSGWITT